MRFVCLMGFLAALAAAQSPAQSGGNPPSAAQNQSAPSPGNAPKTQAPAARIVNPDSVAARLMLATPEQRERALARVPADRQQEIRQQLAWFDGLPKEQQDVQVRRLRHYASLPPDQQLIVRLAAQALAKLPGERRQAVRRALAALQTLPQPQRALRMNNPAFRSRFSPDELKIIEDLADGWLLPPAQPAPVPPPK
jgi:hypothetical protein